MYFPKPVPGDIEALPTYLASEFRDIADNQDKPRPVFGIQKIYKAPVKPFDGQIVYADGTHWNPGSGQGIYYFNSTIWKLLG